MNTRITLEDVAVLPLETRSDPAQNDDPIAAATAAVEELRSAASAFETRQGEALRAAEARIAQLETRLNRPGTQQENCDDNPAQIEERAFGTFIRGGASALNEIETRALNIGTPAAGGYVTIPEYSTRIIEGITEFSPIRSVASVMSIGSTEVYIPVLAAPEKEVSGAVPSGWVTETGPRVSTEPVFDQANIKVYEQAKIVPITQQLLEDSAINLLAYVTTILSRQFGKEEASAFVLGDGNGKPTGFLTTPANYEQVVVDQAVSAGAPTINALIDLFYALPTAYAARGSWLMNRKTMAFIRGTLDTTSRVIWGDSLATGQPPTLLGRPVLEAVDMPDWQPATAADTYPVAFGDFSAGYQIVDRVNFQIMRDDYTGADTGLVKLRARRRVGGKPTLNEAIVLLKSETA